jgi:hypothetical protein
MFEPWEMRINNIAIHGAQNYAAFVLSSSQGFTPPHVVAPPYDAPAVIYELLGQQAWQLRQNNTPMNWPMFYEIIEPRWRTVANPDGFSIANLDLERHDKLMLINFVQFGGRVFEVAALNITASGQLEYFHRLVKRPCENLEDRNVLRVHHGISHRNILAENWGDVQEDLNDFVHDKDPRKIVISQPSVRTVLDENFNPRFIEIPIVPWDQRPGQAAFYQALRIKHLRDSAIFRSCPYQCHENYDITLANITLMNGLNNGYFEFISGFKCAQQEVNELYFRIKNPMLYRTMVNGFGNQNALLEIPRTAEE